MCQQCGNLNNWSWNTNSCGCGCKVKCKKGDTGAQGATSPYPANLFATAPLLTNSQMLAYVSPTKGLVVYNTTNNQLYVYTTSWQPMFNGTPPISLFHTNVTRTAVAGSGTVTVTTTFLPKLIFATTIITSLGDDSTGGFGRSNGTSNSCKYTLFTTAYVPIASETFCIAAFDGTASPSENGFTGIINNFTATSFDIVYTKVNSGQDITVSIDVIG